MANQSNLTFSDRAALGRSQEGTESTVRIVIASDFIGALSSRRAGEVIASGWLPGAEVSVLPIGEAGAGFAAAYAELAGFTTSSRVADGVIVTTGHGSDTGVVQVLGPKGGPGIPYEQSSRAIGDAIADLLRSRRCAGSLSIWLACGSMTPAPACSLRWAQPQIGPSIEVSLGSTDSARWTLRRAPGAAG